MQTPPTHSRLPLHWPGLDDIDSLGGLRTMVARMRQTSVGTETFGTRPGFEGLGLCRARGLACFPLRADIAALPEHLGSFVGLVSQRWFCDRR
jgi:hypothetical protein